ncbi:chitin binding peritrophin-A domain-containing protein [Pedobacter africanus]|uniref:Chitin binding Peritrophin-A domain-containing protein n=1 Tax=Pedobacter africanus TaxID=151894 RepID=A0A1W2AVH9_9SPHI|nr:chitin binding peritrophin-A domain-containing protein [Pedobacter africanus]SMC64719.1 Chitin binding Peritrophin-A domain-containing protein [Pedobacter africanus]
MKKTIFACLCLLAFFSVTAQDPPENPCVGKEQDVIYAYPTDCRRYFVCVETDPGILIPIMGVCATGTYFSDSEKLCTTMANAKNPAPPCNYVPPTP